jgi:hypothetical protein
MNHRDPTKSLALRQRGRGLVNRKVFNVHTLLRQAVLDHDVTGLRSEGPMLPGEIIAWIESKSQKMSRSEMMMRQVVGRELSNEPHWLWKVMADAVEHGIGQAERELKHDMAQLDSTDLGQTHGYMATAEVIGIASETERRMIRHTSHAVLRKRSPEELMREIRATLEKITKLRLHLLVNTGVVRAVNAGKLHAYKHAGIKQVGIDPEWLPHIHDAKRKGRGGKRKAAKALVVAEVVAELLAAIEEEQAKIKLVNVLTAGDDRVCDDCLDIAEGGPYDIDQASDLIPAHPNCRCSFIPWGDRRFAAIQEQEE